LLQFVIGCCVIFLLVWLSFDLDIFIGGEKARKKGWCLRRVPSRYDGRRIRGLCGDARDGADELSD
jgi:hypothetical protein